MTFRSRRARERGIAVPGCVYCWRMEDDKDIDGIVEFLARWARGYGNKLKWNEQEKFKADLNNSPDRWREVSPDRLSALCRRAGMSETDSSMLAGWLGESQAGKRFRPRSYRTHKFQIGSA